MNASQSHSPDVTLREGSSKVAERVTLQALKVVGLRSRMGRSDGLRVVEAGCGCRHVSGRGRASGSGCGKIIRKLGPVDQSSRQLLQLIGRQVVRVSRFFAPRTLDRVPVDVGIVHGHNGVSS